MADAEKAQEAAEHEAAEYELLARSHNNDGRCHHDPCHLVGHVEDGQLLVQGRESPGIESLERGSSGQRCDAAGNGEYPERGEPYPKCGRGIMKRLPQERGPADEPYDRYRDAVYPKNTCNDVYAGYEILGVR